MDPLLPLQGITAFVEVRSNSDNRSAAIRHELEQLGAKVETCFTDEVTLIVFKEGMKRTWNRAVKRKVPLVSVSWLDSCKTNMRHMPLDQFPAKLPDEDSSPLLKRVPTSRWKKMKSMQPCDFDDDLARSAERGERQRRRIILKGSRSNLAEDSTPQSSSPIPILALETQARSPYLMSLSKPDTMSNKVIPDTPPSMKERLDRMRQEQKNVLGADDSPIMSEQQRDRPLQRRLFDKLANDLVSTGNSSDDDEDNVTARVVASLIQGLESHSDTGSHKSTSGTEAETDVFPQGKGGIGRTADITQQLPSVRWRDSANSRQSPAMRRRTTAISGLSLSVTGRSPDNSQQSQPVRSKISVGKSRRPHRSDENAFDANEMGSSSISSKISLNGSGSGEKASTHATVDKKFCLHESHNASKRSLVPEGTCSDLHRKRRSVRIKKNAGCTNILGDQDINGLFEGTSDKEQGLGTLFNSANGKGDDYVKPSERIDFENITSKGEIIKAATMVESKSLHKDDKAEILNYHPSKNSMPLKPKISKKKNLLSECSKAWSSLPSPVASTSDQQGKSRADVSRRKESTDVSFLFSIASHPAKVKLQKDKDKKNRRIHGSVEGSSVKECIGSTVKHKEGISNAGIPHHEIMNHATKDTMCTNVTGERSAADNDRVSLKTDFTNNNTSRTNHKRQSLDEFSLLKRAVKNKQVTKPAVNLKRKSLSSQRNSKRSRISEPLTDISRIIGAPSKKLEDKRPITSSEDNSVVQSKDTQSTSRTLRHARSLLMEQAQDTSRGFDIPCFLVVTSLHREEQELVYSVVKKLKVFGMTNRVDHTTTHVVCGEPRRTLNILHAIARGCWLLKQDWVLASLEAGEWLQEELYEMVVEFPAAKRSRCERQRAGLNHRMDLFSRLGDIFVSQTCTPPRVEVVKLIELCSGKVTRSEEASIYISDIQHPSRQTVKPSWILDSIMSLEALPTADFTVGPSESYSLRESSPEF